MEFLRNHRNLMGLLVGLLVLLRARKLLYPQREKYQQRHVVVPPKEEAIPEKPPPKINDVHRLSRAWGLDGKALADLNIVRMKHYVSVVADENNYCHKLQNILKNVESVEILSATLPKSVYKVKSSNDTFPIRIASGVSTYYTEVQTTHGEYDNILDFLIDLNDKIFDAISAPALYFKEETANGTTLSLPTNFKLLAGYDSLFRKIVFFHTEAQGTSVSIPMGETSNSCHGIIGSDKDETIALDGNLNDRQSEILDTSVRYAYERIMTENYINNRPTSYYQAKIAGYPTSSAGLSATLMPKRMNMAKQIHVNIDIDEIVYWDGTSRLIQVHIPYEEDIKFTQRPYPINRRLRGRIEDIDRLTFRFRAVQVDEEYDYDFNGVPWSLELELTTLEFDDKPLVDFDPTN